MKATVEKFSIENGERIISFDLGEDIDFVLHRDGMTSAQVSGAREGALVLVRLGVDGNIDDIILQTPLTREEDDSFPDMLDHAIWVLSRARDQLRDWGQQPRQLQEAGDD